MPNHQHATTRDPRARKSPPARSGYDGHSVHSGVFRFFPSNFALFAPCFLGHSLRFFLAALMPALLSLLRVIHTIHLHMFRQVPNALTASRLVLAIGFFVMLSFYQYKGR